MYLKILLGVFWRHKLGCWYLVEGAPSLWLFRFCFSLKKQFFLFSPSPVLWWYSTVFVFSFCLMSYPPTFSHCSLTRTSTGSTRMTQTSSWTTQVSAPFTPTSPSARTLLGAAPPAGGAGGLRVWSTSWAQRNMKWRSGAPAWSCPWTTQWSPRPPSPWSPRLHRHAPSLAGTDCKKAYTVRMQFVVFSITKKNTNLLIWIQKEMICFRVWVT